MNPQNSPQPRFNKRKKILFVFIYAVVLIVITELMVRAVFAYPKTFQMLASDGEINASAIWRHQWIKRKRQEMRRNPETSKLTFNYGQHHPIRGWQLRAGSQDPNAFGEGVTVNSQGIRGVREYPYTRVPGKRRILILGDSFTFGTEVGDDETYPYHLQQLLPQDEVINMGVFGYGHDQMLLYLKEEGVKYNPDIVIIGYLSCDDSRNVLDFRDYAKPVFQYKAGELTLTQTPIPTPDETLRREWRKLKIIDLIQILARKFTIKSGAYKEHEQTMTKTILKEMIRTIQEMGAVPVIAHIDGIRNNQMEKKAMKQDIWDFIHYWVKEEHVLTAFLLPYLEQERKKPFLDQIKAGKKIVVQRKYGHFSPWENQKVAEGLRDYLVQAGLVK
ncbi:MAG: hypothetical protein KC713_02115 [Candidatus Omnitrophica bacterium]|nr:hypothetical protein [Candidatus Omnitrophota bacterium]